MKRGFEEVLKVKTEVDAMRASFEVGYAPQFSIEDGETVEGLWFNGTDDEPGIIEQHTKAFGGNKYRSTLHREGQCVPCYLANGGDKSISKIQKKGVFLVADPRLIHKVKDEQASTNDKTKYKYSKCGGRKCKSCAAGHAPERSGQKVWEPSMTWVFALMGLNDKLKTKCVCGGSIKKIEKPDGTLVSISCSKCKDPLPVTMFMVSWDITRTGKGKNTSYNFQYNLPVEDQPDWVIALKTPDLNVLYREPTIEQQCRKLECPNPFDAFAKKAPTVSYDSDEEAEGDDLFAQGSTT